MNFYLHPSRLKMAVNSNQNSESDVKIRLRISCGSLEFLYPLQLTHFTVRSLSIMEFHSRWLLLQSPEQCVRCPVQSLTQSLSTAMHSLVPARGDRLMTCSMILKGSCAGEFPEQLNFPWTRNLFRHRKRTNLISPL